MICWFISRGAHGECNGRNCCLALRCPKQDTVNRSVSYLCGLTLKTKLTVSCNTSLLQRRIPLFRVVCNAVWYESDYLRFPPFNAINQALHSMHHCYSPSGTKSPEQSPVFTARTDRHQNFQTQTKDLSFSTGLSLNLCSSICFVFILFYFISPRTM